MAKRPSSMPFWILIGRELLIDQTTSARGNRRPHFATKRQRAALVPVLDIKNNTRPQPVQRGPELATVVLDQQGSVVTKLMINSNQQARLLMEIVIKRSARTRPPLLHGPVDQPKASTPFRANGDALLDQPRARLSRRFAAATTGAGMVRWRHVSAMAFVHPSDASGHTQYIAHRPGTKMGHLHHLTQCHFQPRLESRWAGQSFACQRSQYSASVSVLLR